MNWTSDIIVRNAIDEDYTTDYDLIFENKDAGVINTFTLFVDSIDYFSDVWTDFMKDFNTDQDCQVVLSGLNGESNIRVSDDRVKFTAARCGYGGLHDFSISFTVPKSICNSVFGKLLNYCNLKNI